MYFPSQQVLKVLFLKFIWPPPPPLSSSSKSKSLNIDRSPNSFNYQRFSKYFWLCAQKATLAKSDLT